MTTTDLGLSGVALTFDDGPDERYTLDVLDVLEGFGVRGAFFMTGKEAQSRPGLVEEVAERGHTLGNHCWDHLDLRRLSEPEIRHQALDASALIEDLTGQAVKLIRPPYGGTDLRVDQVLRELGLVEVGWSVEGADWEDCGGVEVARRINEDLTGSDIALMHDGRKSHLQSAIATGLVLEKVYGLGFTVADLGALDLGALGLGHGTLGT